MKPEEKAKELVEKFMPVAKDDWVSEDAMSQKSGKDIREQNAKQCALILVDQVIGSLNLYTSDTGWWEQVKQSLKDNQ